MKNLRASVIRLAHENPSMRQALLKIIKACDCEKEEAPVMGRFEEGVPADPTENMSEEDAKEWKRQNELNRDNFTAAQKKDIPRDQQQWFHTLDLLFKENDKRAKESALLLQKDLDEVYKMIRATYPKMNDKMGGALVKVRYADTYNDAVIDLVEFFRQAGY